VYAEKGLDEELAWFIQCMVASPNSPHPSVACVNSLTNLLINQDKSYPAFDFVDVSHQLSSS
jgi:hypothetical protein